jgi:purine-binding chemotaxis protein CheW
MAANYAEQQSAENALVATFSVRGALCALDAAGVQEVIRLRPITPVRHAPEEVAGIINLRGRIVTVLDLGLRLGFGRIEPGPESRIVIVNDRSEFIGLLVDRMGEVTPADPGRSEALPANISPNQAPFFRGICRAGNQALTLLDKDRILEGRQ